MLVPYLADVAMRRWPIANFVLIGLTVVLGAWLFFPLAQWEEQASEAAVERIIEGKAELPAPEGALRFFLLQPGHFHVTQLVGCVFAHAGIIHLVGNMIFLWVFGNAINAKFGHPWFLAFYFGAAVFESTIYMLLGPKVPSLGASGAIMGVVGAFLILYPRNDIRIFFLLGLRPIFFTLSSMWLIALYIAFDLWGLVQQGSGVAYISHVAGVAFGIGITAALVKKGVVTSERNEENLLQVFGWQTMSAEQEASFGVQPWKERRGTPATSARPSAARASTGKPLVAKPAVGKPAQAPAGQAGAPKPVGAARPKPPERLPPIELD